MKKKKKRILLTTAAALLSAALCLSGCAGRPDPASENAGPPAGESVISQEDTTASAAMIASEDTAVADTAAAPEDTAAAYPVTFLDSLNREVTVSAPQRVAVMIGSFADIWCLAGGKESLVASAHDTWTYFDLDLNDSVIDIGNTKEPNLERLAASEPDFIIASSNTEADVKLLDTFEAMGMNVAYFQVSNFNEYLHMLDICTRITGERDRYHQYGELLQEQIDRAKAAADGSSPTVLYVRASGSSCKVKNSRGSVLGEMLHDLGCVNIADSADSLLEDLNMESILAADPDYIFVVLQGADKAAVTETLEKHLISHPAWQSLTAVQEGRYHILDDRLYNLKPNARWGDAYENLAGILYPGT
ncbi:MAG: ABC transporter substrate-binding protein [Hungatella sp.]|nr:ABC transporter substrate-binding protein [Hungatella sp.]